MSDAKSNPALKVVNGECAHSSVCPLSRIEAGACVRIHQLAGSASVNGRLRELGVCEDQQIRILTRGGNLICQVCNARLGLSEQLAEQIIVEPVPRKTR